MSEKVIGLELRRPAIGEEDWELDEDHPAFRADPHSVRMNFEGARVEILWEESCIAVAEGQWLTLSWSSSAGDGDHDHYIALRLIERRDHPIWQELPWRDLPTGKIFYAWDHYLWQRPRSRSEVEGRSDTSLWDDLESAWETGRLHKEF